MRPFPLCCLLLLPSLASAQTHTPAAAVVQGDTVTIDGSFCWHDAAISSTIAQGNTLTLPGIYANPGGREPIKLKMAPGTHKITVLGFADVGSNLRKAVEQTVTIGTPTRESQLIDAYKMLESGKDLWRIANEQIAAIKPTRDEVIAALQALATGGI